MRIEVPAGTGCRTYGDGTSLDSRGGRLQNVCADTKALRGDSRAGKRSHGNTARTHIHTHTCIYIYAKCRLHVIMRESLGPEIP